MSKKTKHQRDKQAGIYLGDAEASKVRQKAWMESRAAEQALGRRFGSGKAANTLGKRRR